MIIPESFKIGALTYKVHLVDRIDVEQDNDLLSMFEKKSKIYTKTIKNGGFLFGVCDSSAQVIWIATKDMQGNNISPERIEQTFYHELAHALVGETANNEVNRDEVFIEALGKNIYSYCLEHSSIPASEYIEDEEEDEEIIEEVKPKKVKSKK